MRFNTGFTENMIRLRGVRVVELDRRYQPVLIGWCRKHPETRLAISAYFSVPFYYVEYGIAQLAHFRSGRSLSGSKAVVERYKSGLKLATKTLPELFRQWARSLE